MPAPAPALPPPAGDRVDAGDVYFHVTQIGRADPRDPVPVVFLHGGGPGCTAWSDFGAVAPLFAADRRCLLVDLLQYGRSAKCTITGPMWDFHAARLLALLNTLGVERADLVCNSWGGTIALAFAAARPDRVRSLVVTGSMPVFHGPLAPLPEGARRGRNARDAYYGGEGPTRAKMRDLMARLEWYDPDAVPEETLTLRHEQSLDPEEMKLAARSDSPRGEWQELGAELGRIQAPVLYAWGMHDAFLTPDYPLMLARMTPHGHLYVMDRAGHHLQEERPADYHAVVSGFLACPVS